MRESTDASAQAFGDRLRSSGFPSVAEPVVGRHGRSSSCAGPGERVPRRPSTSRRAMAEFLEHRSHRMAPSTHPFERRPRPFGSTSSDPARPSAIPLPISGRRRSVRCSGLSSSLRRQTLKDRIRKPMVAEPPDQHVVGHSLYLRTQLVPDFAHAPDTIEWLCRALTHRLGPLGEFVSRVAGSRSSG